MNLLVIRHAIAEDKDAFATTGADDSARPLTKQGRKRMKEVVRGLRWVVPTIDVLASSPFVRAMQTAEIVAQGYDGPAPIEVTSLVPGGRADEFVTWLVGQGGDVTVAIVGHEPSLGQLASGLLAAKSHFIEFRKGGACLITWPGVPAAASGQLRWLLEPKQLRRLAAA
jgi:phosphohistidine phosphatase